MNENHDLRRRQLIQALGLGVFMIGGGLHRRVFSADRSVHLLQGEVFVNGQRIEQTDIIRSGDLVETSPTGQISFTIGTDAFLLRENSRLQLGGKSFVLDAMRLLSGKMLGVFGRRVGTQRLTLSTPVATMGIRGTGTYVEALPDRSYICTCYGSIVIASNQDLRHRKVVKSEYHNAVWVEKSALDDGSPIMSAGIIDHEDHELVLLESLLGRYPSNAVMDALARSER